MNNHIQHLRNQIVFNVSVDYYEIRYSSSPQALKNSTFDAQTEVASNSSLGLVYIISGNVKDPQYAGATEVIIIMVNDTRRKYLEPKSSFRSHDFFFWWTFIYVMIVVLYSRN